MMWDKPRKHDDSGEVNVFRLYYLPVLFAQQNDSQSEEINVINDLQAENVPVQEAKIR